MRLPALQPGLTRLLMLALLCCSPSLWSASGSDFVPVTATAVSSPPKVVLTWQVTGTPTGYTIARRNFTGTTWTTIKSGLAADAVSYEDATVASGVMYEYWVTRSGDNKIGYVVSGVDLPFDDAPGTVVLLVDQTVAAACAAGLDRYKADLISDGWKVIRHDVPRDDGSNSQPPQIRSLLQSDLAAHPDVKGAILFGRVPIPKSGYAAPDGHDQRPMPADTYYADLNGTWTDSTYNVTGNVPGDGIFDQNSVPTARELMVGRIDMKGLTSMGTETALLNNYLDKNHRFRWTSMVPKRQVTRGDNHATYGLEPYMSMCSYVGRDSYLYGDTYWRNLRPGALYADQTFVAGYNGCAGDIWEGSIESSDYKVCFVWQGASYYMEYQNDGNQMRKIVASPSWVLANGAWSDYSTMPFREFSMGVPLGRAHFPRGVSNPWSSQVFQVILGDPLLRMWMVAPVSNLAAIASGGNVALNWSASPAAGLLGYHVYRADSLDGTFTRLTSTPVAGTSYTDATARPANVVYLVRALSRENRGSGLYLNMSHGVTVAYPGAGSNSAPTITTTKPATLTVNEDTAGTVTLAATDANGDTLTWSVLTQGTKGTASASGTGSPKSVSYTPTANLNGTDSFVVQVSDGKGGTDTIMVNVTITAVNDVPVAAA